ncbi:MAG: type II toxin-antitoxin system RelB/DinJ family antitoxin [Terracidiphilus sp.]|jgi:DNA-damage-inducible protein J
MPANAVVRARIDEKVKVRAAAVLETMGLTVSDAFRLLLVKIAAEQKLPFEIHTPNAETIAAMQATERGAGERFHSPDALFDSLGI